MRKSRNVARLFFAVALSLGLALPALARLTKISVGYSAISGDFGLGRQGKLKAT